MYLDKILGTSTKVNALSVLMNNPEGEFVENELAKKAGCAVSELNRQIPDFVEIGLVSLKKVGRAKVYSINKRHFLFHSLCPLFRDLNDVYMEAAKEICRFAASKAKLHSVILFGSAAKRSVKHDYVEEPSDIDMLFIVENEQKKKQLFDSLISFINEKIALKYGIVCYPIVITKKEHAEGFRKKERLIIQAEEEGIEIYPKLVALHSRKAY